MERTKGRPRGFRINRPALDDLLQARHMTKGELAVRSEIPSLSGIINGHSRASMKSARALAQALDCHPQTLFPELGPFRRIVLDDFDEADAVSEAAS